MRRRRRPPRGSCRRRRRRRRRRQSGLQLLGLSLPLALSGCANAEGRAAVAVAEQRASVVHKTLLSPPPLPPPPLSGSSPLPARLLSLPPSPYSPLVLSPAGLTLWSRGEKERRTASETANGHSSAAARFTQSFKLEGTFTERHSTARPKGSQAERAAGRPATAVRGRIIPMLRVSVAVGRSVGRGGDRYDMHAASGSEERSGKRRREKRRPRFSPIRKRGGTLSVGPQPRI